MAPQQPCSGGMKTSQPFCCSTAQGGPMRLAEQGLGHATDEERHSRPLGAREGRNRGSLGPGFTGGGRSRVIRPRRPGIRPSKPSRSAESHRPTRRANRAYLSTLRSRPAWGKTPNRINLRKRLTSSAFPESARLTASRNGSIIRPYCTPEGHAVSHARQSRHDSRCLRIRSLNSGPSATIRMS